MKDLLQGWLEFWKEFSKSKAGLAGLAILLFFVALAVFSPLFPGFREAEAHWRDINYWLDLPQAAPPVWTNWIPGIPHGVESSTLTPPKVDEQVQDSGAKVETYTFTYPFQSDTAPRDLIVQFKGQGQVPVRLSVTRPDGTNADLYSEQLELNEGENQRVSVARNCAPGVIDLVRNLQPDLAAGMNAEMVKPSVLLFATNGPEMESKPQTLKGNYTVTLTALLLSDESKFEVPSVQVAGYVYGVLGTDMSKRDVWVGIVVGVRWALIIGVLASLINVIVGLFFGIFAAYYGKFVDWILNRLYEYVYLMPVLPFIIVTSAIYKPSIWTLIGIICLFFWTGSFKPVYSMALQIREETFVEASRALGASRFRIILKHIVPVLLPYSFAVMALGIPGVIVYESSVSFLGLGDATIVTWGQILHDSQGQGAVINNLWWWVVPPGLMIAFLGLSFALLGTAFDKILHPKLKTR